jgi:hypothetical protein
VKYYHKNAKTHKIKVRRELLNLMFNNENIFVNHSPKCRLEDHTKRPANHNRPNEQTHTPHTQFQRPKDTTQHTHN